MFCKKLLQSVGIVTSVSLLLSSASHVFAFSDVSPSARYSTAIQTFKDRGVIEGYTDNTFRSNNTIQRDEFLKIVLEARGDIKEAKLGCFTDTVGQWSEEYVCSAKAEGIVEGFPQDGTFRPDQAITFVEAAKILAKAYGLEIDFYSSTWFEPFVIALEGSKAIPPTVDALDRNITRGEMVEMMWRLADEVTDQETKGYLNVKYPDLAINLASDEIQYPETCTDVRYFLEEASSNYGYHYGVPEVMPMVMDEMAADSAVASPQATARVGGGAAEKSFSETNVQVQGVDEADIVKTDGDYLYIVRGGEVSIVDATPPQGMEEESRIRYQDSEFYPSNIYVHGDRLVVLGQRSAPIAYLHKRIAADVYHYDPHVQRAEVHIYDITDKDSPELVRTVAVDGNTLTSRRIDDTLYLVVNQYLSWYGPIPLSDLPEEDILPRFDDSAHNVENAPVVGCRDIAILPHVRSPEYLTIASIPLNNEDQKVEREVIFGSAQNVYASLKNLYIATQNYHYIWRAGGSESREHTNVYRFDYTGDGVEFEASGSVPGRILNQFSMDEYERHFRIATTKGWGATGPNISTNNLYVLNMDMETVGEVEDIAPGETIYSTRFMGDRTYMVTFRQVDPFFVIDTSDPRNPEILGKLKIPGFSNYLHPYDENHIIGFGKDTEEEDGRVTTDGVKIALFDVTNVRKPTELHKVIIGDQGTDSPLLYNHKALLFEKDRNLLAFPIQVHEIQEDQKNDEWVWGRPVFQGAHVYNLSIEDGFELDGTITHYDEEDWLKSGDYWYPSGSKSIQRIVRIDDSLYTISNNEVQAHGEDDVDKEGEIEF